VHGANPSIWLVLDAIKHPPTRARVRHRCYTGRIPTKHPRHAITETPRVRAALDELRGELGHQRVELGELVILGANAKLEQLRAERTGVAERRRALAEQIRRRALPLDVEAADAARRSGWARP
jgi:hypothetical protein